MLHVYVFIPHQDFMHMSFTCFHLLPSCLKYDSHYQDCHEFCCQLYFLRCTNVKTFLFGQ